VDQLAREVGTKGILVVESHEGRGEWKGMESWSRVLDNFIGDSREALDHDPCIAPEDNATIIFTSGTYVITAPDTCQLFIDISSAGLGYQRGS
jgi:hypothetical protein